MPRCTIAHLCLEIKQGNKEKKVIALTQRVKFISDELTHLYGVNDIYYIEKSYRYHYDGHKNEIYFETR